MKVKRTIDREIFVCFPCARIIRWRLEISITRVTRKGSDKVRATVGWLTTMILPVFRLERRALPFNLSSFPTLLG